MEHGSLSISHNSSANHILLLLTFMKDIYNYSQSNESNHVSRIYRVRINYRRILQNLIFTNTEQKHMMLLPFDIGMFAVS